MVVNWCTISPNDSVVLTCSLNFVVVATLVETKSFCVVVMVVSLVGDVPVLLVEIASPTVVVCCSVDTDGSTVVSFS